MKTLVVDSSIIVKWLNTTDEQHVEDADKILSEALKGNVDLTAPELAKYEIGNVLILKKKLSAKEAKLSLHALYSYPIEFITEFESLAQETCNLALSLKVTYYDASFLALAKMYGVTLVTENVKHQGRALGIKVVDLKDH